ncbi:MAG: hypothetical protein U0Q03_07235 [Acidimicrobiales bacterium]
MFRSLHTSSSLAPDAPRGPRARRRGARTVAGVALATALVGGLAACGDDDDDDMNPSDVSTEITDLGSVPGTMTGNSTGMTTGDSTMTTPVSGSVSNDDGGSDATTAP